LLRCTVNPVRDEVLRADCARGRAVFGLPEEAVVLLAFGGSRGARHLNEALLRVAPGLLAKRERLHIVQVAGPLEYEDVLRARDALLAANRYQVHAYLDNLPDALAAADVAVTRAGATTIAELTALGLASVLVPYPYATDDHQTKNAAALAAQGGARLVADSALDSAAFETALGELLADESLRATMATRARARSHRPAARPLLADGLLKV
jgi:UDP-N-acetylglucosamine--N-acetylmuramyl-(pentapeptide) pyrophosphoryl-undecaprenol N-acetylglucosamine transferase